MFKIFTKKQEEDITIDEREELIKDYLYKADSLAGSFQYNRKPYRTGGIKQLDKFIADLQFISNRIKELETSEMSESRTEFEKLLDEHK